MKCDKVRTRLAGYLDYAVTTAVRAEERAAIREHLAACVSCREELERYRKLSSLLSRMPKAVPPPDLAVRIRVAAAQLQPTLDWRGRWQHFKDRAEVILDNTFRPLTVPATGGFFSAIVVFFFVLQMIVPGISVKADPNDVPTSLLQPAALIALSDLPGSSPEEEHSDVILQHDLVVDVVVDARGQMMRYDILNGTDTTAVRHQLDQLLLFSRFRPMLSFGRPTPGGHVVLSFSAVHVRG